MSCTPPKFKWDPVKIDKFGDWIESDCETMANSGYLIINPKFFNFIHPSSWTEIILEYLSIITKVVYSMVGEWFVI